MDDRPSLSDDQLIAQVRATSGDERDQLIAELFGRHHERVARWCFRFTGNRDAAGDLAQDVFVKALRHLNGFKGSSRFTTWLYTIVRNESLNRLRGSARLMEWKDGLDDLPSLEDSPHDLAERHRMAERIRELLVDALDQVERSVFTLHYGDDMPLDAILNDNGVVWPV